MNDKQQLQALGAEHAQRFDADLDWLARNVHEWADGADVVRISTSQGKAVAWGHGNVMAVAGKGIWFTRDEWLTRRAELQNKPSWDDAPAWAEWLAQHSSGYWCWGRGEAKQASDDVWYSNDLWYSPDMGTAELSCMGGEVLGDWRDTLERRPQASKSEPPSDDWHKLGEFPPIGTECEILTELGWNKAYVVGFDSNGRLVCHFNGGCHFGYRSYDTAAAFRQLQTERERVASEIVDVMMALPVSELKTGSEHAMDMALAIYDKFLSKQGGDNADTTAPL